MRTSRPPRYGCTRHWRGGARACPNNLLVAREVAETHIVELLQARLYTPENVARLVNAVNTRLHTRQAAGAAEREHIQAELRHLQQRLDGLRRFVERGDSSLKVRQWLGELEQEEDRLEAALGELDTEDQRRFMEVHPGRSTGTYRTSTAPCSRAAPRARQLLQQDVERMVIHPVRNTPKPFARAEVVTTGKGLLERVAFVVAGARNLRAVHLKPAEVLIK